jgi:hypothetical protein
LENFDWVAITCENKNINSSTPFTSDILHMWDCCYVNGKKIAEMPHKIVVGLKCSNDSRTERAMVFAVLVPHVWTSGRGLTRPTQSSQLECPIPAPGLEAVWQRRERLVHGPSHSFIGTRLPGKALFMSGFTEGLLSASLTPH